MNIKDAVNSSLFVILFSQIANLIDTRNSNVSLTCGANGMCNPTFIVEDNGNIHPCDFYETDQYLLGNINEDSLETIKNNELVAHFINERKQTKKLKNSNIIIYEMVIAKE